MLLVSKTQKATLTLESEGNNRKWSGGVGISYWSVAGNTEADETQAKSVTKVWFRKAAPHLPIAQQINSCWTHAQAGGEGRAFGHSNLHDYSPGSRESYFPTPNKFNLTWF